MGHLVEQLAPEYGFDVPLRLDIAENEDGQGITRERFRGIDVAVEFLRSRRGSRRYRTSFRRGRQCRRLAPRAGLSRWIAPRRPWKRAALDWCGARTSPSALISFMHLVAEASRQFAPYKEYRRLGLGDSSHHKKGCAQRHAAENGGRDEKGRSQPARGRKRQPRRRSSGNARNRLRFGRRYHHACGTRRAAARVSREARSARPGGWSGKRVGSNLAMFCSTAIEGGARCLPDAAQL